MTGFKDEGMCNFEVLFSLLCHLLYPCQFFVFYFHNIFGSLRMLRPQRRWSFIWSFFTGIDSSLGMNTAWTPGFTSYHSPCICFFTNKWKTFWNKIVADIYSACKVPDDLWIVAMDHLIYSPWALCGRCSYPHHTDKETQGQWGQVTGPRSQN